MRRLATLLVATSLAACQPVSEAPPDGAVALAALEGSVPRETCGYFGSFALAIVDGRRQGLGREEALRNTDAGPLTPVFVAIVEGVYDAPRPRDAAEWEAQRRLYAGLSARSCLRATQQAS